MGTSVRLAPGRAYQARKVSGDLHAIGRDPYQHDVPSVGNHSANPVGVL